MKKGNSMRQGFALLCCVSLACVLALVGLTESAAAQDKIILRLNLPKGSKQKVDYKVDMVNKVNANGRDVKIDVGMGITMSMNVLDVDVNKQHKMQITYDRIKFKMAGVIGLEYDSDKKQAQNNPMTGVFDAMVGQSLVYTLGADGKVTAVSGIEELAKKIGKTLPGGEEAFKKQLQQNKQQFAQMVAAFPDKPVGVGDSWDGQMEMNNNPQMPMTISVKYTLKDRQNGNAIIGVDGKIESKAGLNGKMTGEMMIHEKTGWTQKATLNMNMAGNVGPAKMNMAGTITVGQGLLK